MGEMEEMKKAEIGEGDGRRQQTGWMLESQMKKSRQFTREGFQKNWGSGLLIYSRATANQAPTVVG